MMETATVSSSNEQAFNIQVSGLVQGVGFRPTVWNLLNAMIFEVVFPIMEQVFKFSWPARKITSDILLMI